ncbi:AGE family epimerase/isomerase [Flagellimonas sp. HMM57]|uniref:AGE family epimerase/isomerase n=1 Tax=unclassified Flagellimonas TaxID=2644544 RepID=UPI0013D0E2DD|nr:MULTISPECIES: AGE family epimerase/isomerase [unclassified Flagellimonas]UII76474.1 AGE family epimerase/isomerase [Flagellimonas sp. HMM57]
MEKITHDNELLLFQEEVSTELQSILDYWQAHSKDDLYGGFVGKVDNFNNVIINAPKGIILNTRLLWTFSRACNFYEDSRYDNECQRAFDYLLDNFRDYEFGGVFWELDHLGNPLEMRKQIYAQAFCIYALSEYYRYSKNSKAILWALELFRLIEDRAYDKVNGGYIEAFDRKWKSIPDMRLSEKDLNAPKTTNTHLHILEAYTVLYEMTGNPAVENALTNLLELFHGRIFEHNNHMKLFFTTEWKKLSTEISFGHDIEAVWLMLQGSEILQDKILLKRTKELTVKVTKTFVNEALDTEFGVINSKDSETLEIDWDRHWWPQAEAMVGLLYNWKITKDPSYFNICKQIWSFITKHIIDHKHGEWFFRVDRYGSPCLKENKIGPWKCPYHNSRALIEILQLLRQN